MGAECKSKYGEIEWNEFRLILNKVIPINAYIEQTKGMFKNNFVIDSPSHYYTIEGNFMLKSFTIFEDEREIAKISRKAFKSKRQYGIAMVQDADMNLILGASIALEITRKIKRARNSGS